LDVAQQRAQSGARREALTASDQLRRQDLGQTFNILDAILAFISSGRGQAAQGFATGAGIQQQRQAANQAFVGGLLGGGSILSGSRFKEGFESVEEEEILDAIKSLPVYEWKYVGSDDVHIGPMAEDFMATFGLGSDPEKIEVVDAVGTLMVATQALAKKVDQLESNR
jgi:hypothetical protein